MRTLTRSTLIIGAAVLLAACSGAQPPIGAPATSVQAPRAEGATRRFPTTPAYQVLHRFGRHDDPSHDHGGANPQGGLIDVNGTLYGTAEAGGHGNNGVVYSISTTGAKTVLYRFRGQSAADGSGPTDDLTDVNGTLYGTTYYGGRCGEGTVYSITTAGREKVLHNFCGTEANPTGGVIDVNGMLYGSTTADAEGGSVYQISTSRAYKVLYRFPARAAGGPNGRLLSIGSTLYGTTLYGGTKCPNNGGCGTVYSVTTSGKEKVVYSFGGPSDGSDGWLPNGGLIDVNGTMYGTTFTGGKGTCYLGAGCGIVYSVTTSGVETVVYRFDSKTGGQNPNAALTDVNGALYGTTEWGGGGSCEFATTRFTGCGTVYSLTSSGVEQVLHTFVGGSDGANPEADLVGVNGVLYGTTSAGGQTGCEGKGCGTVFGLSL